MQQPTVKAMNDKPRLLSKYFFLLTAVSVFSGLTLQFFNTTTSLYVKSLGGAASFTGMLLMLFTITATIVRIVTGRLVDTMGRRKIILSGLIIFAVISLSFSFFPFLGALPFLRFFQGIGYSMSATAISVAITDVIPKQRMGEGIGYFGLGNSLTQAIGPGLALGLIFGTNFNPVFYVAAGSLVISAIFMLFCNYEKDDKIKKLRTGDVKPATESKNDSDTREKSNPVWVYFEKSAIPFTVISMFTSISMSAVVSFLMLYATTFGIKNAGLYFTFSAIFTVLARLLTGKITDKYGPLFSLVPGFLISIISFILIIASSAVPALFYIAGILYGFGNGITGPALNATVIKKAPDSRRGAASATFMISYDIGFGIGGIVWGLIIDFAGFTAMFGGCALFVLIAIILSVAILKKKKNIAPSVPDIPDIINKADV